jgi:hypothetical protein
MFSMERKYDVYIVPNIEIDLVLYIALYGK